MRPSVSPARRMLAGAAAALLVAVTFVPVDADARAGRGGSFGSRGAKTYDAPPATSTAPGAAPMQRSVTQPGQPGAGFGQPAAANRAAGRPGGMFGGMFGGGLMGGLMGGLLGAGLFGLLSGSGLFGGLGSMASILGLVIQFAIIFFVARLAMKWWRSRQSSGTPAAAAAGPSGYRFDGPQGGASNGSSPARIDYGGLSGAGGASQQRGPQGADVEIGQEDYEAFERLLTDVQEAWSKQDLSRLRGLATPEMVEIFADDLAEDASRGVVNTVSGVKLLQGDLSEAWAENGRDYATVAMRYELVDVTEERESGRVVEGDTTPTEATELWTFLRAGGGGKWLLTAIQQAA